MAIFYYKSNSHVYTVELLSMISCNLSNLKMNSFNADKSCSVQHADLF